MVSSVDLFCEDQGHEGFGRALIKRIATEEKASVAVSVRSASGGIPRLVGELGLYQIAVRSGSSLRVPDLLVVMVDCDDLTWHERRQNVLDRLDRDLFPRVVALCPDPHVEAWYLADLEVVAEVLGTEPPPAAEGSPKERFATAVQRSKIVTPLGGLDIAQEVVERMHLYRAGNVNPSLRNAMRELRAEIRRLPTT